MRGIIALAALVFAACAAQTTQPSPGAGIRACGDGAMNPDLGPAECRLHAGDHTLIVRHTEPAADDGTGVVSVDVLDERGGVLQTMTERDIPYYLGVDVQDVDGDGRGDIVVAIDRGVVNTVSAVWVYSSRAGRFERAGEVSGVVIERTREGLIAVPARSTAADWSVAFYRLDTDGLHLLASVDVHGEERDGRIDTTCSLASAPGIGSLGLTAPEVEQKFCAEPVAAHVFGS
ncbi:MAG: hypothetical protein R3C30_09270 [Hyphomonadaceae bacterium]